MFRISCSKEEGEKMVRLIDESGDGTQEAGNVAINDVHVLTFLIKVREWKNIHHSTFIDQCPL